MHINDVHKVFYLICELGRWVRGSYPRVGSIRPYSENAWNLLNIFYIVNMHLILEIQRSVAFGGFKLKVVANIFTGWEIINF